MGRLTKLVLWGVIPAFFLSSCSKRENIPATPVLTFNSFTPYLNLSLGQDSAILAVNFTDGNGDVGYSGEPQQNFFIKTLWDSSGHIVPFSGKNADSISAYQIPNLTPTGSNKELTGIIRINMNPWIPSAIVTYVHGDTILFNVWLVDRAGNKSNILVTPKFMVP